MRDCGNDSVAFGQLAGDPSSATASEMWDRGMGVLRNRMDPQIFSAFIRPLRARSFDSGNSELFISAPSRLICNHVDKNFKKKIVDLFTAELGIPVVDIKFDVDDNGAQAPASAAPGYVIVKKTRAPQNISPPLHNSDPASRLNPRYTFENFVVGTNNQFCHAAAMRVAEKPGLSYNPLFIYGGVGLGKTHLLHAIGNSILANKPSTNLLYLSSETFTNELISGLKAGKMEDFKKKFRGVEVLLVDDIQFMGGKERTQEEFFHTFNALYAGKHQIVITSDRLPQDVQGIEERLQTRFSWGLIADLQAPDFETRVAILKGKAALQGMDLPSDVAEFVAESISSNVRELEGALTRLQAHGSLSGGTSLSVDIAKEALRHILRRKVVHLSVKDIQSAVSEHYGIKISEMVSKRRTRNLSFPRHVAMFLCRKHTTCSYPEIGSLFGGRDHSSVIHAASVVGDKAQRESLVRESITQIERMLLGT